jgi:DtxR family transcriptional regulator, Mn-dependent transcriptional regulator
MATKTVENYIKRLYLEEQRAPGDLVAMSRLAELMGVVAGTATTMVRALADSGLVIYEPRGGVRLSPGGEQLALHVLRRHRLIELFLVEALGMDWADVHAEAEELEHAVSDKVLERIDKVLDHPTLDPHGDPIPNANGQIAAHALHKLSDVAGGQKCQIVRVLDQDPAFLKFADNNGLSPKMKAVVRERNLQADAITIKPDGDRSVTLSIAAAAKFLVKHV